MAFGSEIIAKLGLDTQAFSTGMAQAKTSVEKFGDDVGSTLQKKLSGRDIFRGFLQGLGIGSAQQIADKIVEPFRKAAEYAREIADLTSRVADSNIARMRSDLSAADRLTLAAQDRERMERQFTELAEKRSKTADEVKRQAELELEINRSIAEEKRLARDVSAEEAALQRAAASEQKARNADFQQWLDQRRSAHEAEQKAAADKQSAEQAVARNLADQKMSREAALKLAREQAEVARLHAERERATLAIVQARIEVLQQEALRAQLGSAGRDRTTYLIDGINISGQPRDRSAFTGASPEALEEFIRRQEALMGRIDQGYGQGPSALVEVVTGGLIRALAKSTLQTEIGFARDRLNDFNRFSGKDRLSALRDFEGDPLAFDRLFETSQRNLEASERAAAAAEQLTDLFRTGRARAATIPLTPGSG